MLMNAAADYRESLRRTTRAFSSMAAESMSPTSPCLLRAPVSQRRTSAAFTYGGPPF
jgi:hypothetical protein